MFKDDYGHITFYPVVKFKGAYIPSEILCNKNLSPVAKILFPIIETFDGGNDLCCATNEQFSRIIGVSTNLISKGIVELVKEEYIIRHEGDKRARYLYVNCRVT